MNFSITELEHVRESVYLNDSFNSKYRENLVNKINAEISKIIEGE